MEIELNIISKWLESEEPLTLKMFDEMKELTRSISPNEQILFLKKVINEIAKGNITLSIENLKQIKSYSLEAFQEFNEPMQIDYTLDLVIHTLYLIYKKGKFPHNTKDVYILVHNLADFICDYLQNNIEYLNNIDLLFDNCPGRLSIIKKDPDDFYINLRGKDYKIYDRYKDSSIYLGRLLYHYDKGIYTKGLFLNLNQANYDQIDKEEKLQIFPNNFWKEFESNSRYSGYLVRYFDTDGVSVKITNKINFNDRVFYFKWMQDDKSYIFTPVVSHVKYCEGRKSPLPCRDSKKEFWWCYGSKCFKANQNDHSLNEWKNYTLRDFIKILNLKFDEEGYYIFISEISRINRLLERIKCIECNTVLRPIRQTRFGFYRVSSFHCKNDKCSSKNKKIYLTHCLNSRCSNVIDSRVAKRCSNGFIICDKCGSCCSNDQFARRIDALNDNGEQDSFELFEMWYQQLGHWDKAECFCYKCQKEMEEKNGIFICKDCNVTYDRNVYIRYSKDFKEIIEKKRRRREENNNTK